MAAHSPYGYRLKMDCRRHHRLFTCGWAITEADEDAIRQVPEDAWKPGAVGADAHPGPREPRAPPAPRANGHEAKNGCQQNQ